MENRKEGEIKYIDKELKLLQGVVIKTQDSQAWHSHLLNDPMSIVWAKKVKINGALCYFLRPADCPLEDLPCFMNKEDFERAYCILS